MNPLDHASYEASVKLFESGIVLDTDACWYYDDPCGAKDDPARGCYGEWSLQANTRGYVPKTGIPAPSMTEVWRELPTNALPEAFDGLVRCRFSKEKEEDYLVGLLIWLRKEKVNGEIS